ncbi:MAG: putative sporulation protein YtxC [Firmicutes bacterium]|nr:putative sporulation protein YtxC [Bacillota bacterium]
MEWVIAEEWPQGKELPALMQKYFPAPWQVQCDEHTISLHWTCEEKEWVQHVTALSRAIARIILMTLEERMAEEIAKRYPALNAEEQRLVLASSVKMLDKYGLSRERREDFLTAEVMSYFAHARVLHLSGFQRFRLGRFQQDIQQAIAHSVEDILMDREYRQFIAVLQDFVQHADARLLQIHVFWKETGLYFEDEKGEPVGQNILRELVSSQGLSLQEGEEILVSAIVSLAPHQVVFHGKWADTVAMKTVKSVFGEGVSYCTGCARCFISMQHNFPYFNG